MRARAVVVVLIGAVLACGCAGTQDANPASSGQPAASTAAHLVLADAAQPVVGVRIHVPAGAVDVVASAGALWVAGFGAVSRLDPATGRIESRIRTPNTGDDSRLAVGDGSIWITAGRGAVYRIDPSTNRVIATVHLGGSVSGIAVGAGRVWVTRPLNGSGEVTRINPRSNRQAGAPIKVGPGPGQVIYGRGAVWIQDTSPASVMKIDPETGHVSTVVGTRAVPVSSPAVGAIAVGYDSLWAAGDDTLTRVDPRTGRVLASVHIPRGVAVATGAGEVWVLAYPRSSSPTIFSPIKNTAALWEVDPKSDRIIGKPIRLGVLQPIAITATQTSVWVADYNRATVTRVRDPQAGARALSG